jgi:hypothetical protein
MEAVLWETCHHPNPDHNHLSLFVWKPSPMRFVETRTGALYQPLLYSSLKVVPLSPIVQQQDTVFGGLRTGTLGRLRLALGGE